jgi:hypothetical protein
MNRRELFQRIAGIVVGAVAVKALPTHAGLDVATGPDYTGRILIDGAEVKRWTVGPFVPATGTGSVPEMLTPGEIVLTPDQQRLLRDAFLRDLEDNRDGVRTRLKDALG